MRYDTIIFDLDGTLLDTLGDLHEAVNYALEKNNCPTRTPDEVRNFVGNGIGLLVKRALPQGAGDALFERTFADFKEYYIKNCVVKTRPYEGIMELLAALKEKNVAMAVVSNKNQQAVSNLAAMFFSGLIETCVGENEGIPRKPAPDLVYKAMEALGADREKTVYAGDSDVDIMTAKNAGIDVISVTWGFRNREFLKENGACVFADTPEQILKIMEGE